MLCCRVRNETCSVSMDRREYNAWFVPWLSAVGRRKSEIPYTLSRDFSPFLLCVSLVFYVLCLVCCVTQLSHYIIMFIEEMGSGHSQSYNYIKSLDNGK